MSLYSDLNEVLTPYAQKIKDKADKSTTYTKTEVDNLISEVEVETDTTLDVPGAPADSAETGRQIGLLKADLGDVEDIVLKCDEQLIDRELFEQKYYWYNSNGNVNKTYNANGTAYYAYPKIILPAGKYYINYTPNNFAFLKTVSTGDVVTLKSVTTNNSFSIAEDTEFYLTVYDSAGTLYSTVMLANAPLPNSYIYGKYNCKFKYVTIDSMACSNSTRNIHTVGVGGDYDTIQSACDNANEDDVIFVLPGVYTEQISIWGKKLHLIGFDKKLCTIIDHSGEYDTPPVEMNIGTIANFTIIEDGATPSADSDGLAYCIHNDNYQNTDGQTFEIVNCDMINDVHACIGFGMYANYTVKIRNCTMRSNAVKDSAYKRGALYFHANSGQNIIGQKFIVEDCIISSADTISVYAGVPGGGTGDFTVRFSGNQVWSDINGTSNNAASISESNTFILDSGSTGNSIAKLNNVTPRQGSKNTVTVNASSSAAVNNKKNRVANGGVFEFCVVSEDRTSYDTGIIKWDSDGALVIEQKNLKCNVTFSTANGELRVWNRDTENNHTYSVSIKPF